MSQLPLLLLVLLRLLKGLAVLGWEGSAAATSAIISST
jgi:hypothetical protein